MERRRFLGFLAGAPVVAYAAAVLTGCGDERKAPASEAKSAVTVAKFQTFAYYAGLFPDETRDPSDSDGTTYDMPCITQDEIDAGLEKSYDFWHGHGGVQHRFTITSANFATLKAGKSVEIYTTVVEGHRHSLLLSPTRKCESKAC